MITTKHDPKLVSSSPKTIQLDNRISFDALKQATRNKISLLNGKVFKDIHFFITYVICCDCDQYKACMLHNDENVMTMFSMFTEISKLICLELYIIITNTPTQTYAHPPSISTRSLKLEGLDEYIDEAMNLEWSFKDPHP